MTPMARGTPQVSDSSVETLVPAIGSDRPNGRSISAMHSVVSPAFHHLSTHDDCPSPLSSDSDFAPTHLVQHPSQATHVRGHTAGGTSAKLSPQSLSSTKPEFSFTPSTSPFLGPFRTLNLHSTNTSRAPSPMLLPSSYRPHSRDNGSVSPIDASGNGFRQRPRGSSIDGSPLSGRSIFGPSARNRSFGDVPHTVSMPHVHTCPGQLSLTGHPDCRSGSFPAPQFSNWNSPGNSICPVEITGHHPWSVATSLTRR